MNKAIYIGRVLLTALIVVFSLQIFRVFITTVIWNMSQYLPGPYSLAIYALALFASVLLLPLMLRIAGSRVIIAATGFGIVVMRLAMQALSDPGYMIVLSSAGIVFFMWFFTAWIRSGFDNDTEFASVIAIGFPSAMIIDLTSRIFLLSYDIVWIKESWALMSVGAAGLVVLVLLWLSVLHGKISGEEGSPGFLRSLLVAGIGPWLYLSMGLYQNPSAAVGITNLQDIQSQMMVCLAAALGALMSALLTQRPNKYRIVIAMPLGVIVVLSTWMIVMGGNLALYSFAAGAIALWAMPGFLFSGYEIKTKSMYGTSIGMFAGFLIFLILVFMHANFKIFEVTIAAAVIIAISTVLMSLFEIRISDWKKAKTGITIAGLFCILSVFLVDAMVLYSKPATTYWLFPGRDLRVVTYNIHQGLDADYRMNLTGIITELKKLNPEILCLQEVNRAQFSNGLVDCLLPISKALDMSYVYGANHDDKQYGNAILTKYPIKQWDNIKFFHNSNEVRGTLHASIQIRQIANEKSNINIFVTHLDHIAGPGNVRKQQAEEVLQYWASRPRSIIVGDLNAEPDAKEMHTFYTSGLRDALEMTGKKDLKTFWEGYGEPKPLKLDYVFVSPDLKVADAFISESRASDHKAVVVDVTR